ncbi:MAG: AMP-binding protein [Elusimicrobiota bacterium]
MQKKSPQCCTEFSDEKIAFSAPETIKDIQETKLQEHIAYCREYSPYYRRKIPDWNIDWKKPLLPQLFSLPLTGKQDIENFTEDFRAVPPENIVDISLSSGITGKPLKMMYTDNDLKRLAYNEKKSFLACGISAGDKVLLTCTMDRCFIAGLAYFLGLRSLGAAVIRNGLNNLESHSEIIKTLNPTVIVGVPSFLRKLGLYLADREMTPAKRGITRIICIGEPLRDKNFQTLQVGKDLEEIWQAKIFSTYASSETITTFCECAAGQGGHLHPDLAVVEIVDENGQALACGSAGEIVVTPLSIEGMPLIRYMTGDISFLLDEQCSCGRFSSRLGPVLGRKKQMMKIKGTTLYPQSIYTALEEINIVEDYYLEISGENDLSDQVVIHLTVKNTAYTAEMIEEKIQARLRVKLDVVIEENESVKKIVYAQNSRKPVRFFDRRGVTK